MKTVKLDNKVNAEDHKAIAELTADILNKDNFLDDMLDFQADGENIIEYDHHAEESITWYIDNVAWNEDGTASQVQIDC